MNSSGGDMVCGSHIHQEVNSLVFRPVPLYHMRLAIYIALHVLRLFWDTIELLYFGVFTLILRSYED